MKKASTFILILIVIAVVAVGVFVFTRDKNNEKTGNNETSSSTTTQNTTEESGAPGAIEATITYTNDGFSPSTLTVASGTLVTVVNESTETLAFRSDPHPVHTENDELNIDDIAPGGNGTFTVTEKGTWGFHNHLDADKSGSITVE